MAFKWIKDHASATPTFESFTVTDSEAITKGEALIFSSGKLTKAAAGGPIACIAAHSVTAGTGNTCLVIPVTPSQEWEVGYTGTADAAFIVGSITADIDSTGLLLNAADVTGGPCFLKSIDTTNKLCRVAIHNSYTTVD